MWKVVMVGTALVLSSVFCLSGDEPGPSKLGKESVKEKVAYLGVATSRASDTLRDQLKLPPGVGLVIEYVDPKSAADTAGIRKHDILMKLDDQLLINEDQLATLVRSMKPGDKVTLTVVRQGSQETLTATLGEREVQVGQKGRWRRFPGLFGEGFSDSLHSGKGFEVPDDFAERFMKEIPSWGRIRIEGWRQKEGSGDGIEMRIEFDDSGYAVGLTGDEDLIRLTIKDKDGKEIFRGSIKNLQELKEQVKHLPEELGKKLEKILELRNELTGKKTAPEDSDDI